MWRGSLAVLVGLCGVGVLVRRRRSASRPTASAVRLVVAIIIGLRAAGASAIPVFINGSFEQGLSNWETFGDVSTSTAAIGTSPTDGSLQALITTLGVGQSPYSGTPAPLVNLPSAPLPPEIVFPIPILDFLGVSTNEFATFLHDSGAFVLGGNASAIAQTVNAQAGDQLLFDYNYVSTDAIDTAFLTVVSEGPGLQLFYGAILGGGRFVIPPNLSNVELPCFGLASCTNREDGYQTFSSFFFPISGSYRIGFLIGEELDPTLDSALFLDNFRVTTVPEPSTALLMLLGLAGVGAYTRRRHSPPRFAGKG